MRNKNISNIGFGAIISIICAIGYVIYLIYSYSSFGATDMAKEAINNELANKGFSVRIDDIKDVRKIGEYEEAIFWFGNNIQKGGDLYKGKAHYSDGSEVYICFYRKNGDGKMRSNPNHVDISVIATICE